MKRLLPILFTLILLAGCLPVPRASSPWTAADLRYLDPAGDTPTPATDILAVYTRTTETDFELRVDLLDISFESDYHFFIYLIPSPSNGDPADRQIEISLPLHGPAHVFTRDPEIDASRIIPRVSRDPWLDTVVVRLNRHLLPESFTLNILTLRILPDQINAPDDIATHIAPDGDAISNRAPLLLAFWDAFPAATPAQALRRWDGAHTGPTGERHGLRYLLEAAGDHRIPLVLLDLKTPPSLAALDYVGGLGLVTALERRGLLLLPDVAPASPTAAWRAISRQAGNDFSLPDSLFIYAPGPNPHPAPLARFASLPDAVHLGRSGWTRLIPLPTGDGLEATEDGPTLEVRQALMAAALSHDPADLVVLGGSLPATTWGDSDMADPTMAWIGAHPWIQPLDAGDLLTFPTVATRLSERAVMPDPFLAELQAAPSNPLTDIAWQTYFVLSTPTADPALQALREVYRGQIGILLAASRWAEEPYPRQDCSTDLDLDGQTECLLANLTTFAVLETDGARLSHLFYLDENGPHQLIGPTVQFQVGVSDPSLWDLTAGEAADPGQVLGAFSDRTLTFAPYRLAEERAGMLALTSLDGTRTKTFTLAAAGLTVGYHSPGPVTTVLNLVVDPWHFFQAEADYTARLTATSWTWGPAAGPRLTVTSAVPFLAQGFTAATPFLGGPEDPDLAYPVAHYLPFPVSQMTIYAQGDFSVQLAVTR
ncbi:MAG: hypothetical protein JXB85_10615 [Anaerolineales bacterium]|nr:hypothetical protein [Anaerolineales bacterium]